MSQNNQYNTIEEALRDLREGKVILVTDDPDRENEGDLICAAEFATRENINFMATYAKGLICTPMSAEIAARLNFPPMVAENTDNHSTAFTVAVDHADTTTGISAEERSYTIMKCVDDQSKPEDFRRPGHVFPLISRKGGVLVRNGHTEATTDLMRLAGLKECGVCCEVMKEDGTMMRTSQLWEMAKEHNLTFITIRDLQDYIRIHEKHVKEEAVANLPTQYGDFKMYGYINDITGEHHLALVKGDLGDGEDVLCRVHRLCLSGLPSEISQGPHGADRLSEAGYGQLRREADGHLPPQQRALRPCHADAGPLLWRPALCGAAGDRGQRQGHSHAGRHSLAGRERSRWMTY